jgi:GAF domain-containing protein
MAKTRTPKQKEENEFQDKIQKRLTGLFGGGEEPPTFMSIRQVEALKERVRELEAELAQGQQAVVEVKTTIKPMTDSRPLNIEPGGLNNYNTENEEPQIQAPVGLLSPSSFQELADRREPAVFGSPVSIEEKPPRNNLNIWRRLVEPAATIKNDVERRQASLVSALLLVLILAISSGPFAQIFVLHDLTGGLILAGMGIGFVIAYIFSRTQSYRLAVPLLLAALAAWPILNIALVKNYSQAGLQATLIFDVMLIIISSTFASYRTTIYLSAANFLGILLLPVLIPGVVIGNIVIPLSFNGVISALVLVFTRHRNLMEKDRLLEISQANRALQASYHSLDSRTRELQLASEVGRIITEKVANLHEMLITAAELISARFGLYYTQVYLIDPSGKNLTLQAGTGNVGQELLRIGHHLVVGVNSLYGRAVIEKRPMIITDTKNNPGFLSNPLLPNTRSEMAIPLMAGEKVVGVLDMQSEQPGALNEANLPALDALAGQLAIAIQNAALFTEAEQARSEVETQIHHLTETSWQDFLDAIDRGESMGFAFDQSNILRLDSKGLSTTPAEGFNVPISVTGTKIGEIQLGQEPNRTWTASETDLIEGAATQLAQQIENLRLLAQAEKYRAEAEQAVRRLTREGWDDYLKADSPETTGFVYDLNEVSPMNESVGDNQTPVIHRPLNVREEIIGELSINDSNHSKEDADELISAVATQLSAHIENLRLSISNMNLLKSTEERAKREHTLRQITDALRASTNPATIMRTAVREVGSILGRKTIVRLSNPERAHQAEAIVKNENEADTPAKESS